MKTHHLIIIALAALLTSCSSPNIAIEGDTGRRVDARTIRPMDSGNRDAEQMRFADEIIATAGKREVDSSGTIYPGIVKVIRWEYKGQPKYTALRLATWPDGFQCWQGPQASSGFYVSKLSSEILR